MPSFLIEYPFAIKVATGKIDAVSGENWRDGLRRLPQNYVIAPEQMWLDGYCVERGLIRQFVAMPLGSDFTVEEQATGEAVHGGIQIAVYPMRRDAFERHFPITMWPKTRNRSEIHEQLRASSIEETGMGLAIGGRMRQEIYEDPFLTIDWDSDQPSRCFVHLVNSLTWRVVTAQDPPGAPFTAQEYNRRGLPWFECYGTDAKALAGADRLHGLASVTEIGKTKGNVPLPENKTVDPAWIIKLGGTRSIVREGTF